MIFCENCFVDEEIKSIIKECGNLGECEICHSKDVYVYNTDENEELTYLFDEFIGIFTAEDYLSDQYPKENLRLLSDELLLNWNIFNDKSAFEIDRMIHAICYEKYQYNPEIFDKKVGLSELYEDDYLKGHSLLTNKTWENFVYSLKHKNRFHTNYLNLDLLEKFCSFIRKPYKKGQLFYRGRVSSKKGYDKDSMGAPPSGKATVGRINSYGESCLYLANAKDKENAVKTTLNEVRAGAFDYVSVGTFELLKDIVVVDLKKINSISPFVGNLDYKEHAINKEHLNKINNEMAKVLRNNDDKLDYIATQYIADFIKSVEYNNIPEYAGVEYNSVMYKNGYNLAIFDESLCNCIDVKVYEIKNIDYDFIDLDISTVE